MRRTCLELDGELVEETWLTPRGGLMLGIGRGSGNVMIGPCPVWIAETTPILLQLDAKLNLGMSGGAVVNLKGELVGLTTAVASATSPTHR